MKVSPNNILKPNKSSLPKFWGLRPTPGGGPTPAAAAAAAGRPAGRPAGPPIGLAVGPPPPQTPQDDGHPLKRVNSTILNTIHTLNRPGGRTRLKRVNGTTIHTLNRPGWRTRLSV